MTESRKLRVYLCHSSLDKPSVQELYQLLSAENWIHAWLDEKELLPGQDWNMEIEKAVESADAIIVNLSRDAITREGYVQRELKLALDIALEKPAGAIFIIPVRLEECGELPRSLRALHYVDYFPKKQRPLAFQALLKSLKARASALGILPKEAAPQMEDSKPIKRNTPDQSDNLRTEEPVQEPALFISYSHADAAFVDRLGIALNDKDIRFWRDIHDATAGRVEKQIEQAIRHNPTVLLVLSKNAIQSDWVEHEVRMARGLEKELKRDVLCPISLDGSWKDSPWPERVMEQVMEYNILDFSKWEDEAVFQQMFARLLDGLQLFYKG